MKETSGRILDIKGQPQYDVLRIFADNMISAFEELGETVDILDAQEGNYFLNLIDSIIHQERYHYKCVFAFNAIFINYVLKNNEYIFDNYGTIFYGFIVDHPLFHHERLLSKRKNTIISCVDKYHADYIEKYYTNIKVTNFVPHAATISKNQYVDTINRDETSIFLFLVLI